MPTRRGRVAWRLVILIGVISIILLGYLSWQMATDVAELEPPEVGVPSVEHGMFLDILIDDRTRDKFASNVWLRQAMNAGHQAAVASRRYQMDKISFKEGQHPETGEPAVIVIITPKAQETPLPAFEPIAVRRWEPREKNYGSQESLAALQRIRQPNPEDLRRLEENFSGKHRTEATSLVTSLYRLLCFTAIGIGFILFAGAYRSFQWMSTKWDASLVEQQQSRGALKQLRTVRREREANQRLDGGA
jgi:hypothetical protein